MKVADYIVSSLVAHGVSDAFGIPGGVILDLLYALDAKDGITPHLCYHEQSAGFAACGYAQSSGRLGVAYATRGPGFTNFITPMADAFYDSLPTLFVTAHASPLASQDGMRCFSDQEMDTCAMVKHITKFAARVDSPDGFAEVFTRACHIALSGRKGPVFLDISNSVLSMEIGNPSPVTADQEDGADADATAFVQKITDEIAAVKRPVVLVGDGIDRLSSGAALRDFAETSGLPFLSSRVSHDLLSGSPHYYGYVGSHGIRVANFILSKADLVVSLGNRLNFPPQSASFSAVAKGTRFIRCEIDESEFARRLPDCQDIALDVNKLVDALVGSDVRFEGLGEWLAVCDRLKTELAHCDENETVLKIRELLDSAPGDAIVVSDVGNCEFWLSRASVLPGSMHRTLYSKSFGALGCGLGKSIGAHYATGRPIVCVVGDQGLMVNIQELQYIGRHRLPITVAVISNQVSGMIRDVETRRFGRLVHVTPETGFSTPDWNAVAETFGIADIRVLDVPQKLELTPNLPRGNAMQDLYPRIAPGLFSILNQL